MTDYKYNYKAAADPFINLLQASYGDKCTFDSQCPAGDKCCYGFYTTYDSYTHTTYMGNQMTCDYQDCPGDGSKEVGEAIGKIVGIIFLCIFLVIAFWVLLCCLCGCACFAGRRQSVYMIEEHHNPNAYTTNNNNNNNPIP